MASDKFEKTNWFWQIDQLQQRFREWLELQLSRNQPNLPEVSLPSWFWKVAFWVIVALLVLGISRLVWRSSDRFWRWRFWSQPNLARSPKTQTNVTAATWRQRAQDFTSAGNYTEACRCLYLAMLQQLNDKKLISHQLSRTDKEYEQLVQLLPQSLAYQRLIETHERLCFGKAEMSLFDFEQCQQADRDIAATEVRR